MEDSKRPTIFHQFQTLQALMMSDRSMVQLLRANQQTIRDVKTIEYHFGNGPQRNQNNNKGSKTDRQRPQASLDVHRSFENYLSDRIKEEKRVRKHQSNRRVERGPQVRGTALQPSADALFVRDKLAKWTNQQTLEGYVTARHLLTRRRIRQRQKEEEQIIRITQNHKRLEALKDLAVKNERYHYSNSNKKDETRDRTHNKRMVANNNTARQQPASNRSSVEHIHQTIETTINNSLTLNRISRTTSLKKKIKEHKKEFHLQEFIQSQTFRLRGDYKGLADELKSLRSQCITILNGNSLLFEQKGTTTREIASLTKIMTCMLTLFLSRKFEVDLNTQVKVSRRAASMAGTSAQLQAADRPTVSDLLYGLMLPSGNDAAYALAEHFGRVLYERTEEFKLKKDKLLTSVDQPQTKGELGSTSLADRVYSSSESNVECFVGQMNSLARHLKLQQTRYSNPHGLPDRKNRSTSNDLAYLCYHAMKNPDFRRIVRTRQYRCEIYNSNARLKRQASWTNTNKLLELEHCQGIKTGITSSAGPCMASAFSKGSQRVIIVILKTNTLSNRFREASFLFDWSLEKVTTTEDSQQPDSPSKTTIGQ